MQRWVPLTRMDPLHTRNLSANSSGSNLPGRAICRGILAADWVHHNQTVAGTAAAAPSAPEVDVFALTKVVIEDRVVTRRGKRPFSVELVSCFLGKVIFGHRGRGAKWARDPKVLSRRDLTPAQNARKARAVGVAPGKSLQGIPIRTSSQV